MLRSTGRINFAVEESESWLLLGVGMSLGLHDAASVLLAGYMSTTPGVGSPG